MQMNKIHFTVIAVAMALPGRALDNLFFVSSVPVIKSTMDYCHILATFSVPPEQPFEENEYRTRLFLNLARLAVPNFTGMILC